MSLGQGHEQLAHGSHVDRGRRLIAVRGLLRVRVRVKRKPTPTTIPLFPCPWSGRFLLLPLPIPLLLPLPLALTLLSVSDRPLVRFPSSATWSTKETAFLVSKT